MDIGDSKRRESGKGVRVENYLEYDSHYLSDKYTRSLNHTITQHINLTKLHKLPLNLKSNIKKVFL